MIPYAYYVLWFSIMIKKDVTYIFTHTYLKKKITMKPAKPQNRKMLNNRITYSILSEWIQYNEYLYLFYCKIYCLFIFYLWLCNFMLSYCKKSSKNFFKVASMCFYVREIREQINFTNSKISKKLHNIIIIIFQINLLSFHKVLLINI